MPKFTQLQILDAMAEGTRSGWLARHDSLSVFAENELQQVMARTYDRKMAALDALLYFPNLSGINPWAEQFAVDSYTQIGQADWLAPGAKDIPRADVFKTRKGFPIDTTAISYGYTLSELMQAQMVGIPLEQRRANAARRGVEEKRNSVVLFGESTKDIPGVLTNAAIPIITAPTGDWFGAATADQMLADLNAMVAAPFNNTKRVHQVNQILLPNAHWMRVNQRVYAPGISPLSVLAVFRSNNPGVSVDPLTELDTAGPSSAPRAIAYERSPDNVGAVVPQMFQQMPPDVIKGGLEVIINCIERLGGGVWFYPFSAVLMDGLGAST